MTQSNPKTKSSEGQTIHDRGIVNWDEIINHAMNLKAKLPDALLVYRVGDYYFAFDSDAEEIAQELELATTLNQKTQGKEAAIPSHCLKKWTQQLLEKGYTIATYDRPYHKIESVRPQSLGI